MILTCPQCETRYQADAAKFPSAGRSVRCAKCGNVWHQLGPQPEPDPEAEVVVQEPEPAPRAPEPMPQPSFAATPRVAAFAPSTDVEPAMEEEAPAQAVPARSWAGRAAVLGGWVLLIAIVIVIGWAGVTFRDNVATWLPQSSSLYAAAGLSVTPHGMDLVEVDYKTQTEDGQMVLAVTGKIVNRSDHELTVPLVRVALFDMDKHELYHWTFVPGVSTLKPGQISKFRTRLSSPPAATHNLEVRFARAGE